MLAALLFSMILPTFNPAELTAHLYIEEATTTPVVLLPILKPVCTCESGQGTGKPQQFNIETGEVLRGVINPKDIGLCQINEYWNGEEAEELGYDIYTESGNIQMANHLYKRSGLQPWNASKGCWAKAVYNATSTPQTGI